eukprot:scaffold2629_cov152-Amphora_coffeaeformis.AAC.9
MEVVKSVSLPRVKTCIIVNQVRPNCGINPPMHTNDSINEQVSLLENMIGREPCCAQDTVKFSRAAHTIPVPCPGEHCRVAGLDQACRSCKQTSPRHPFPRPLQPEATK